MLWFSDFYSHEVITVDEKGTRNTIVSVPEQPSGLGWDKQGELLIVSMRDQKLLRHSNGRLVEHADLSPYSNYWCNDMVVDKSGGAYIGNFGFDRHAGEKPKPTTLVRVDPNGEASIAAEDLWFPNGAVITPDNSTLIIAETRASRLTAFDILQNGELKNRRVFAETSNMYPDGICLDEEGAIWVADPKNKEVIRIKEGGEITDKLELETRGAYACMLGGNDGKTLFVCTNTGSGPDIANQRAGKIETTRVKIAKAGRP
tara:strand:- start:30 stop:806 length:777 start_codon:yes stop_codon:yes gene_type:complete